MKPVMVVRHVPQEALGNLEIVLRAAGLSIQVVDCFAESWSEFERAGLDPDQVAGLVIMGGPMNADETVRFPFLATEVQWLRSRRGRASGPGRLPCAQLLAKLLGSRVYANRVKEIGWYAIEMLPEGLADPLFDGGPATETVFQWHGDTFDLPAGALHLARSAACQHQAFRYGPRAYGLQFHLEITPEMVVDWLGEQDMCVELAGLDYIDRPRSGVARPRQRGPCRHWSNGYSDDSPHCAATKRKGNRRSRLTLRNAAAPRDAIRPAHRVVARGRRFRGRDGQSLGVHREARLGVIADGQINSDVRRFVGGEDRVPRVDPRCE